MNSRKVRQRAKTESKKVLRRSMTLSKDQKYFQHRMTDEVYCLDDDGTGNPMYFNVTQMRKWAQKNCVISALPQDIQRAEELLHTGAVNIDYILTHTLNNDLTPIIVCRGVLGGDRIVDGAHRYVALCAAGVKYELDYPVPGYVLIPAEWRQFVIPNIMLKPNLLS